MGSGLGKGPLKAGALQDGAGHLVGELSAPHPARLALDVGPEALRLRR